MYETSVQISTNLNVYMKQQEVSDDRWHGYAAGAVRTCRRTQVPSVNL